MPNVNTFTCRAIYPVGSMNPAPTPQYLQPCLPRHLGKYLQVVKINADPIPQERRPSRNGLALQLGRRNEENGVQRRLWIDRAVTPPRLNLNPYRAARTQPAP